MQQVASKLAVHSVLNLYWIGIKSRSMMLPPGLLSLGLLSGLLLQAHHKGW